MEALREMLHSEDDSTKHFGGTMVTGQMTELLTNFLDENDGSYEYDEENTEAVALCGTLVYKDQLISLSVNLEAYKLEGQKFEKKVDFHTLTVISVFDQKKRVIKDFVKDYDQDKEKDFNTMMFELLEQVI